MQRIKVIFISLFLTFVSFGTSSCQNYPSSFYPVNYISYIVELDEYGKELKTWIPIKNTLKVDVNNDMLIFIDSYTKKEIQITGSYKFIKN